MRLQAPRGGRERGAAGEFTGFPLLGKRRDSARLGALPGIGPLKVTSLLVLLARQYGVELPGLATLLPTYPTLGEVRTADELAAYQAGKRAAKAAKRAAAQ